MATPPRTPCDLRALRALRDRRTFLKQLAGCAGAAGSLRGLGLGALAGPLGLSAGPARARREQKTKHVVFVAFAGGVRTRETFGTPANVPTLAALAREGVLYPRARTSNLGHYGAALSLFTGIAEPRGIRENARGPDPTFFEYVRKQLAWPAGEVWVSTSGGAQQTNYSHGLHADFGAPYGANTLDGDGIFNREFKQILSSLGKPRELSEAEQAGLERMRSALSSSAGDGARASDAAALAKVERYILDELSRGTADIRGANAADAKALRVARNLLTVFKPALVAVVLQQADVAHGSFNAYVEVVRQNDAALGELVAAIRADRELADSTALVICPEFGRDADLNSRRGLDHGDGSEDLEYVSALAWGPDFRRNHVVQRDVRTIDVCPTVCEVFGVEARFARGARLPDLLA